MQTAYEVAETYALRTIAIFDSEASMNGDEQVAIEELADQIQEVLSLYRVEVVIFLWPDSDPVAGQGSQHAMAVTESLPPYVGRSSSNLTYPGIGASSATCAALESLLNVAAFPGRWTEGELTVTEPIGGSAE